MKLLQEKQRYEQDLKLTAEQVESEKQARLQLEALLKEKESMVVPVKQAGEEEKKKYK